MTNINQPLRVAVITNIIPNYRQDYFRRIFDNADLDVTVFCQQKIPGINIPSVHQVFGNRIIEVAYTGAKREFLGFQHLPIKKLLNNFDVYFIYGNPRIVSNIAISLFLKLLGKNLVVNGQLHTAGCHSFLKKIRLAWWQSFKFIYLYNDAEAICLKQASGFSKKIILAMNNGLDQHAINAACKYWERNKLLDWQHQQKLDDSVLLLSCARLESKNHFEWLIECLPELLVKEPKLLWCVIGDGSEFNYLKEKAEKLNVSSAIRWLGSIYDEQQLAPWFLSSKILIHPGTIGLSLLQAFGFGLPVITHDRSELQMPEFAALKPNINGRVYRYGDLSSLIAIISETLNDSLSLSQNARETANKQFNTEIMAERFHQMCLLASQG